MSMLTAELTKTTIDRLKNLVRVNVDTSEGLASAAGKVDDDQLKEIFMNISRQRDRFAKQLQAALKMNDEDVSDRESIVNKLHRWWTDLRTSLSSDEKLAVLAEAEKAEDIIKKMYEEMLQATAETEIAEMVEAQYREVKQAHDEIRDLRDARKAIN